MRLLLIEDEQPRHVGITACAAPIPFPLFHPTSLVTAKTAVTKS